MTTPWKNEPLWQGQTVAVLASGPSMSQAVADALREHRTIAVNFACRVAPWADMLVALDAGWPPEFREFAGMRLTGVADDKLDAHYIGPRYERVQVAPGRQVEINNSGLAAIRIAAQMGASRILLAGFDPDTPRHFYDDALDEHDAYIGVALGIKQLTAELAVRGISVERFALVEPAEPKGKKFKAIEKE